MRQALIKDGVVENVIEAPAGWPVAKGYTLVRSETASPGDNYSGGKFTRPAEVVSVESAVFQEIRDSKGTVPWGKMFYDFAVATGYIK